MGQDTATQGVGVAPMDMDVSTHHPSQNNPYAHDTTAHDMLIT